MIIMCTDEHAKWFWQCHTSTTKQSSDSFADELVKFQY